MLIHVKLTVNLLICCFKLNQRFNRIEQIDLIRKRYTH